MPYAWTARREIGPDTKGPGIASRIDFFASIFTPSIPGQSGTNLGSLLPARPEGRQAAGGFPFRRCATDVLIIRTRPS